MQTLQQIRGQVYLSEYEKKLFLSKAGKIRTKYRKKCYFKLISEGFFDKNGNFTEKGLQVLKGILQPSESPDGSMKAIFQVMEAMKHEPI